MPSSSSDSNQRTEGWWGDEFAYRLILATLEEARHALGLAIDAMHKKDRAAYARAVASFSTIRQTASRWVDEL